MKNTIGKSVKFIGEKLPYSVVLKDERYAVCVRNINRRQDADLIWDRVEMNAYMSFTEAWSCMKDYLVYTIIDFKKNIRATIGGWGYGIEKDTVVEDATEMINALNSGRAELSRRNFVSLQIEN